jgi:predicted enzyme related to lactoylglutathione lyase
MTGILKTIVFDARDHAALARFYVDFTGGELRYADEEWCTAFTGDGWRLGFQAAADHVPPQWPGQDLPQQMHLDFVVADIDRAAEDAEKFGAVRIGGGDFWHVLADPAGHPFCVCADDEISTMQLAGVGIDCPDAGALAGFYSALLGLPVRSVEATGAWVGSEDPVPMSQVLFQQVEGYNPPRWPDPAAPQQMHLDIAVTDIDAGEAEAMGLGATRLPGEGENWRVYADPAGHPFCLIWDV